MTASPEGLDIRSLGVRYGAIEAVRDVSLSVRPGETVALLGANGAGKTSLLSAIVGLVRTAAGTASLDGEALTGLPPERIVRRGIALSPEGRRVFPNLTVAENLRLGGVPIATRAEAQSSLERVLGVFPRLGERLRQTAGTLSGGEQQMLALGRALMSRPRVLLLDEPSLGLAPIVVRRIFSMIDSLRREGMTMLIVEQNARQALGVSDRAYVLVQGRIAHEASSQELLASEDLAGLYLGQSVT